MKYLLLPVLLSSSALADDNSDYVLNKVTLNITITTESEGSETSNGYKYKLVELKFSNKELLEELVSREILSTIKGYEVVELFYGENQINFYAYNKKTGHAVVIPSDLLSYDSNSEGSDGVSSTTFKSKTKNNITTETWKGDFKAFSWDVNVAGAEGSAFAKGSYDRTATYNYDITRGISPSKVSYTTSYTAEVSGFGDEEIEDGYTVDGSVKSNNGKVVEPGEFFNLPQ